jgi:Ca2+-transporting ATPase
LIYLLLGDVKEALILLAFAGISVGITVIQETRTERVLDALRDLTSPRALVIRGGMRRRIAGREVARGDLIVLAEGDRIPADAALVDAHDLQADESLLTGESVPVRKIATCDIPESRPESRARPGGDDLPFVYSGALVVRGSGLAQVVATGLQSEIGKIGQSLHAVETEPPRLQVQTARLVRLAALGGAAVSVLAVVLYGTLRGGWLDAVLAGVAIGMSMLPEEFPVVLTVFMAMGAWRISKARVLTRRAAAIETLGSATVLCTDKTGTLTENRMSVVELRLPDGAVFRVREATDGTVSGNFRQLVLHGLLASAPEPIDPMEKALHEFAHRREVAERPQRDWKLVHSYGLRPDLLAMTQLWQRSDNTFAVAAKGAPEAIARLCRLGLADMKAVHRAVDAMAAEGLRVLGVAKATHEGRHWPESQRNFPFVFLGLVGLADPLRPSVPDAVLQCRSAGIRIVMITGDYPATARTIAQQAGIEASEVLTGDAVEHLDDSELTQRVKTASIFARIMPEQKLRLGQNDGKRGAFGYLPALNRANAWASSGRASRRIDC